MKTRAWLAALAIVSAAGLVGCEDGPKCIDWDTKTVTTHSRVNGKTVSHARTVQVCDEYEKEDK
ncbi:hypothetical protein [Streptomyces sp. NPDC059009]|uniref:hypothetical protein n=1 Tax=Streptomyces sp. NPDC059009 TaxID=3346694 RepID=UPI0036B9EEB7